MSPSLAHPVSLIPTRARDGEACWAMGRFESGRTRNILDHIGCLPIRRFERDIRLGDDPAATSVLVNHRQAAELLFFHDSATLLEAHLGGHRKRWCGHALTGLHLQRVLALGD